MASIRIDDSRPTREQHCYECHTPLHNDDRYIICNECGCAICRNCNRCVCDDLLEEELRKAKPYIREFAHA